MAKQRTIRQGAAFWPLGIMASATLLSATAVLARDKTIVMTDWSPHGMHAGLHFAV
jgi:hypothetical protein